MTGPEHYLLAEGYLKQAANLLAVPNRVAENSSAILALQRQAEVHAKLADVAAWTEDAELHETNEAWARVLGLEET